MNNAAKNFLLTARPHRANAANQAMLRHTTVAPHTARSLSMHVNRLRSVARVWCDFSAPWYTTHTNTHRQVAVPEMAELWSTTFITDRGDY